MKAIGFLRHIVAMMIAVAVDVLDIMLIIGIIIIAFTLIYAKSNTSTLTIPDSL